MPGRRVTRISIPVARILELVLDRQHCALLQAPTIFSPPAIHDTAHHEHRLFAKTATILLARILSLRRRRRAPPAAGPERLALFVAGRRRFWLL